MSPDFLGNKVAKRLRFIVSQYRLLSKIFPILYSIIHRLINLRWPRYQLSRPFGQNFE